MIRRTGSRPGAALLATALLLAPGAGAQAADPADGLWYFDVLNVQAAHDAGYTGEGVTIAVLDSAVNLDIPTLRDARVELGEQPECSVDGVPEPAESAELDALHGTNVVALLAGTGDGAGAKGVAPGADVLYYRVTSSADDLFCDEGGEPIARAIHAAIDAGADIISASLTFGPGDGVREAVARGLARDVVFVTGLDNQDELTLGLWSTYLNGGVSVQSIDATGAVQTHESGILGTPAPNVNPDADVSAPGVGVLIQGTADAGWDVPALGTGTSYATPIVAGFLAVTAQKYPAATPNQLIQSLIRNTGVEDHELWYDPANELGYGIVSLTHLLRVDPTQYPDENPLLDPEGEPSADEIAEAAAADAATEEPAEPSRPTAGLDLTPVLVSAAVGGGLVLVAGVVGGIRIAVRRSRRAGS